VVGDERDVFRRNAVSERNDRGDWSERRPAEGVRIIRAEEAQAALDAGEAAGKRPDDELRFGDVPPAPSGPRPQHRFPLPDSVDPASAVPRPPLAVPVHEERSRGRRVSPGDRDWAGERPAEATSPTASPVQQSFGDAERTASPAPSGGWSEPAEPWDVGERTTEMDVPGHAVVPPAAIEPGEAPWMKERSTPSAESPDPTRISGTAWAPEPAGGTWAAESPKLPSDPEPTRAAERPAGDAGPTGGTEMPHWSEPPTGEVPKILIGDHDEDGDDLAAWRALGTRGTRWRDTGEDWEELDELGDLADLAPEGALDQTRSEHSDLYSFDEDFERAEAERTGSVPVADFSTDDFEPVPVRAAAGSAIPAARPRHTRSSQRRARSDPGDRMDGARRGGGEDLPSRVVVGIGLIVLLIICYAIGSKALVVLSTVVITAAAAEAYGMLQRAGFRPATLLGLVGTVGVCLGAYWKGVEALPLVSVLVFGGAMMWYLLRIVEARPLANAAVTTMTFMWVAVLGSFSALMLRAHHGRGLFLGAVVVGVAADIAAFLVGRWIGDRPMAPDVSPGKTVEGFIGGLVGALIVGAIIGKELTPWGGMKHGLVLGLVVGLLAPAGDLFESMIKRDLGVKDSGSILPGHGGLLDRFDSLLVVLPAAFYVATLFSIVR
jgi:phosphatidate cytidylyltransferase